METPRSDFVDHCDMHISQFPYETDGIIETRGAKNAALPMIMYSFIHDKCDITLENIPNIADVQSTLDLLEAMGGEYSFDREVGKLSITRGITCNQIPDDLIHKTRISVLLMSVLLAKFGSVLFPTEVGGCKIGTRKFDYHLDAFRSLGCDVNETQRHISIVKSENIQSKSIVAFPCQTTTGTENAMILASNCKSETIIENAHLRTEVLELISFMNQCGCNIAVENEKIIVNNVESQDVGRVIRIVRSDIEEALTYISLGYLTDSNLKVRFSSPYSFEEIDFIKEIAGDSFNHKGQWLEQNPFPQNERHDMVTLETGPYPKIGSDSQPILSALLLHMADRFRIIDHRFSDRFSHLEHFKAYNVSVKRVGDRADVQSPISRKNGNSVYELEAQNLRCAISALLTASYFQQPVIIRNAHYMQRGYSDIFEKMRSLGFKISILS
ncbi:hypothetical protein HN512_04785 [Candidatus Peregrinibacteria bacterium]|jgi:UDP-N-acetylglucosamine 1-carboxyvinyltransferase|nr:hypothetical protein [Candidatus Peregrinibacteria bacterium]MBT3599121.1 hypothetical protein [Candidatus Peregrinibacteria bacterium]MBT4367509.1 hypothetical protein [Candidatus Peregrinibacteria bacterium]MBT4585979.1 hypothetical protein [Candidatus Peregrinibacteria bacterium]MBT6730761.1 hypothetical protein [Candidatus Peregrinibacteria bacterium]